MTRTARRRLLAFLLILVGMAAGASLLSGLP